MLSATVYCTFQYVIQPLITLQRICLWVRIWFIFKSRSKGTGTPVHAYSGAWHGTTDQLLGIAVEFIKLTRLPSL